MQDVFILQVPFTSVVCAFEDGDVFLCFWSKVPRVASWKGQCSREHFTVCETSLCLYMPGNGMMHCMWICECVYAHCNRLVYGRVWLALDFVSSTAGKITCHSWQSLPVPSLSLWSWLWKQAIHRAVFKSLKVCLLFVELVAIILNAQFVKHGQFERYMYIHSLHVWTLVHICRIHKCSQPAGLVNISHWEAWNWREGALYVRNVKAIMMCSQPKSCYKEL